MSIFFIGDNIVLLFPANNAMTREKIIPLVIVLLTKDSKKYYLCWMKVSLLYLFLFFLLFLKPNKIDWSIFGVPNQDPP